MFKQTLLAAAVTTASVSIYATPTSEDMWQKIQEQQTEIKALTTQLNETEIKISAAADAIENNVSAGSKLAAWAEKTTVGGYGEMHYNNLDNQLDGGKDDKDELDLHRFVLFFGHQFTDDVRFYSELEVEHSISGEGQVGEVEVEQAFVEWDYSETQSAKAGTFLMPVGILNETHEPDTFYGVERNSVEKNIIPATWWEGGVSLSGEIAEGLSYDAALTSGLYLEDGKYKIRDGRQKAGEAKADDFSYTARIKYTGIQGLELAATLQYQEDILQGETHSSGATNIDGVLLETHLTYQTGPFALRALYASWNLDKALSATKTGADEQKGWYIEPSFKATEKVGVFARYGAWDNQASDSADSEITQLDLGVNYWLADSVVLKADYQNQTVPKGQDEFDGINLGVGWSY
jgi:hypothetical protein|tara:strand:- start:12833 stop:14050 length:1218 start_codon:yes stop_codon:yes gene_type:complete